MRHRHPTLLIAILLLSAVLVVACGGNRNSGSDSEDEVQSGIATGIAATQAAQTATSEAEAAIAQAVEATLTAQAAAALADNAAETAAEAEAEATPTPPAATSTVASTATPTDEPTPTPPTLVVIPNIAVTAESAPTPPALIILPGGGSGDGMEGVIVTQPEFFFIDDDPDTPVFSREMSLQMLVRVLDEGSADGAGIESVEIEVVDDGGDTVYVKSEQSAGYCLFGGGEPDCATVSLTPGARWPGTNRAIEDRGYTAYFTVIPEDSSIDYGEWQQNFEVRRSAYGNSGRAAQADIRAELVATEYGSASRTIADNLVFQVKAADLGEGNRDGDGIDHVVLGVIGPDNNQVYAKRENDAAFCAFGGDSPCPAWDFAENDNRWPDGKPIRQGTHLLRAIVVASSGDSQVFDWQIEIQAIP